MNHESGIDVDREIIVQLLRELRDLMKSRSERGEAGNKKAEGLYKRLDALVNRRGYPSDEEACGIVRDVVKYPPKYWNNNEFEELKTIFARYGDIINPWVSDMNFDEEAAASEKKHALTLEDFDGYLAEKGIDLRYNVISRTYENGGIAADDFTADTYSDLVNRYTKVSVDIVDMYAARLSRRNSYNPVLERVKSVSWDGVDRLEDLCDIIRIAPEDKLSRTLVRKWCCQAIALAQNEKDIQIAGQGVLVLQGAQNAGKSTLCRRLAFDDQSLFTDAPLRVDDRDSVSRITSRWICELSELGRIFRRNDSDAIKQFLTSPQDSFRVPYGRHDETHPRRVSFIATLNPHGDDYRYLSGDGGDRRFWTVLCQIPEGVHFDFAKENALDIKKMWRQAFDEVNDLGDAAFKLTDEEMAQLVTRNKEYAKPIPGEEELRDILAEVEHRNSKGRKAYKYILVSASQLKMEYEHHLRNVGILQISAALSKLGFKQQSHRRYYFPVPIHSSLSVNGYSDETDAE